MRILLADDHTLFRASLRGLVESRGHEVVGEASEGRQAVALAAELKPDLVLMDLNMPGLGGIEAVRELVATVPHVKVVILTGSIEDEDFFESLRAGAHGYMLKDLALDSFFQHLDRAIAGDPALTPELSRKLLQAFSSGREKEDPDALTERESSVLQLIVEGCTTNRQLAKRLDIAENTVKFHVRNILDKLHLHNRAQAVSHALKHGLTGNKPPKRK